MDVEVQVQLAGNLKILSSWYFQGRISTQGDPCSHYREWVCSAGFWLSSRPFWIRTTFIWVHQGPPVIVLIFFFWNWLLHRILKYVVTNFRKKNQNYYWWTLVDLCSSLRGLSKLRIDSYHPAKACSWKYHNVAQAKW